MSIITTDRPQPRTDIPVRRISAFIYGNILVLSALVPLSPDSLQSTKAFLYVLGVGLSTFVAHVGADLFAHLLRHPDGSGLYATLKHDLRDAVPIVTSTIVPTVVLVAAWLGWIEGGMAWTTAIGATLLRLSFLGPVAAWVAREPVSPWPFVAGVLLALSIAVIALLKAMLTH